MGLNSEWINKAFNRFGPDRVLLLDDTKTLAEGFDHWIDFCRVQNVRFSPAYSTVNQMNRWEGEDVETQRRITGSRGSLTMTLLEDLNPAVMQLVHGDKLTRQTKNNPQVKYGYFERLLTVDQSTGHPVQAHFGPDASCCNYTRLKAPTVTSSLVGTPGTYMADGTVQYIWIQGVYKRTGVVIGDLTSLNFLDADKFDIKWTTGSPSYDVTLGSPHGLGVPNGTGSAKNIQLSIVDPTGDVALPDFYVVWHSATDSLAAARVAVDGIVARNTGGTTTVTLTTTPDVSGVVYSASKGAKFHYNSNTYESPIWTALTLGSDVDYENDRGVGYLHTGSTRNGLWVRCGLFYVEPYSVENNIGPTGLSTDMRTILITSLEPEVEGGTPLYPEGRDVKLYKVDFAGLAVDEDGAGDGFYAGTPVTLDCLTDPSQGGFFGKKIIKSNKLRSYTQQNV